MYQRNLRVRIRTDFRRIDLSIYGSNHFASISVPNEQNWKKKETENLQKSNIFFRLEVDQGYMTGNQWESWKASTYLRHHDSDIQPKVFKIKRKPLEIFPIFEVEPRI